MYLWWTEDAPLVEFYLLTCQARVTIGDSGLCCCVCVMSFEHCLTPLFVDPPKLKIYITYFKKMNVLFFSDMFSDLFLAFP